MPGRDIFVQAWYQGGISILDFTDSENPVEIAYFDRGPIDAETLVTGGYWSVYWYDGLIYGTEILRGLDVFELIPSEHLTANEIAAARLADQGEVFNPQQQFQVSWPAEPAVALAYVDQLLRDGVLSTESAAGLGALLERAGPALASGSNDKGLAREIRRMARSMPASEASGRAAARKSALEDTLKAIAARLT